MTSSEGLRRFLAPLAARQRRCPPAEVGRQADPLARKAHETIARVTDDIDRRFVFNTLIAAIMSWWTDRARARGSRGEVRADDRPR